MGCSWCGIHLGNRAEVVIIIAKCQALLPSQPDLSYEHVENCTRDLEVRRDLGNPASPVNRAHVKRPLMGSAHEIFLPMNYNLLGESYLCLFAISTEVIWAKYSRKYGIHGITWHKLSFFHRIMTGHWLRGTGGRLLINFVFSVSEVRIFLLTFYSRYTRKTIIATPHGAVNGQQYK